MKNKCYLYVLMVLVCFLFFVSCDSDLKAGAGGSSDSGAGGSGDDLPAVVEIYDSNSILVRRAIPVRYKGEDFPTIVSGSVDGSALEQLEIDELNSLLSLCLAAPHDYFVFLFSSNFSEDDWDDFKTSHPGWVESREGFEELMALHPEWGGTEEDVLANLMSLHPGWVVNGTPDIMGAYAALATTSSFSIDTTHKVIWYLEEVGGKAGDPEIQLAFSDGTVISYYIPDGGAGGSGDDLPAVVEIYNTSSVLVIRVVPTRYTGLDCPTIVSATVSGSDVPQSDIDLLNDFLLLNPSHEALLAETGLNDEGEFIEALKSMTPEYIINGTPDMMGLMAGLSGFAGITVDTTHKVIWSRERIGAGDPENRVVFSDGTIVSFHD